MSRLSRAREKLRRALDQDGAGASPLKVVR
jgi:DNA-directed RNA polymerase specialized sigma24 family protein